MCEIFWIAEHLLDYCWDEDNIV